MQMKEIFAKANKVVELAEQNGWSEEELAKVIMILHSHFEQELSI